MLAAGLVIAYLFFVFVAWSILYVGATADAQFDAISEEFP
ncbi:MAG: hypothetical protein H6R26_596 [Proteobacteria bacterium]|nr:hypothetical protein [Pseudomonadota bacterium]